MKKQSEELFIVIIGIIILMFLYVFYHVINIDNLPLGIFSNEYVGIGFVVIIVAMIYYLNKHLNNITQISNIKYKEKLFNSLVNSTDTIYLMLDSTFNNVIYMTNNVNRVLGNSMEDDQKLELSQIKEIFKMPVVDSELRNWDKKSEFVSQMIAYRQATYQHNIWIKIKIYPLREKKKLFYIVLISDATKEHDRQHLLVSQASDIKSREKKLDQITASSYDTELDVNLATATCSFINLKGDKEYSDAQVNNYVDYLEDKILNQISLEDREQVKRVLGLENLRSSKTDEPITIRYKLNSRDEKIWLESTVFFTTSKGDRQASILTKNVTEDAESIRKQNILLQNALQEAEQASKAKSEFLSTMSHEIRTPMNAVIGLSSAILQEDIPESIREDVENINSASNNILNIIDGLLDISKVESGKLSLNEKEYKLAKVIKDAYNITKENIGSKNINLQLDVNKNLPSSLFGDSGKIGQILINLLNNAVKFTDQGSITIGADCERLNSKVKLSIYIQDTGIGMTDEEVSNLLKKEKQNNKSFSIVRKLIDILNGSITIESKVGIGTKITVSLEQKIISEQAIGEIVDYKENIDKTASFSACGKKALIIDDNKINIKVASKFLNKYGIDCESALSGQACLDLVKNNRYDIILLDQKMPDMDGITTLKHLKENKDFNTPVVVLTADAIKGVKEKYLNAGFDDYLSKPIHNDELDAILHKYLG